MYTGTTALLMRVTLAALVIGALAAPPSAAQTIRGTITGTVIDSTGGVVPGITVTVTNQATGIATSAVTGRDGAYNIPLLSPGTYQGGRRLITKITTIRRSRRVFVLLVIFVVIVK